MTTLRARAPRRGRCRARSRPSAMRDDACTLQGCQRVTPPASHSASSMRMKSSDGAVAEQLALVLLVEGDAVLLHQRDEVLRRVARQRRAAEVRVVAQEVLVRRARVEVAVGEVAAAAAGDADLLGDLLAWSTSSTFRPRWPATPAQNRPAAPAPITTASKGGHGRADSSGHGARDCLSALPAARPRSGGAACAGAPAQRRARTSPTTMTEGLASCSRAMRRGQLRPAW